MMRPVNSHFVREELIDIIRQYVTRSGGSTRLTRQPVHVDAVRRQPDAHVPVAALGHDPHLEVVEPARRRDGVRGAHARRILVCFAVTCKQAQNLP